MYQCDTDALTQCHCMRKKYEKKVRDICTRCTTEKRVCLGGGGGGGGGRA